MDVGQLFDDSLALDKSGTRIHEQKDRRTRQTPLHATRSIVPGGATYNGPWLMPTFYVGILSHDLSTTDFVGTWLHGTQSVRLSER